MTGVRAWLRAGVMYYSYLDIEISAEAPRSRQPGKGYLT
jgi:hypothetical protein